MIQAHLYRSVDMQSTHSHATVEESDLSFHLHYFRGGLDLHPAFYSIGEGGMGVSLHCCSLP